MVFHHLISHRHKVLYSQPVQLRLHLHLPLIRHPHRKPRLGVTTHPCVASRYISRFFRRHHITLVFSRFIISALESISPWSFIITVQKYEFYFNYDLFLQLFINFSSYFLKNDKDALEKKFYSQERFALDIDNRLAGY